MTSDSLIGEKLGDYEIVEKIGQGGMADIYKGRHRKTKELVAIKLIGHNLPADPALTKRFRREARAVRSLDHPNIIEVSDYGEHGGGHYMVMEYIKGTNLQRRIKYRYSRKRDFKPDETLSYIEQIASALDYAHKKNIIHRDVKPSNVLMSKKRRAILSDFGLVMLRDRVSQQTQGESFGTPEYIAPEQAIDSRAASPRSDVYSLGVLLYELTTGHLPFEAESAISLALAHIDQDPIPPRKHNPNIPTNVEAVILKAMAKEPKKRYASAGAMAAALRAAYGDRVSPPEPAPPAKKRRKKTASRRPKRRVNRRLLLGGAILFLLLASIGLLLLWQGEKGDPRDQLAALFSSPLESQVEPGSATLEPSDDDQAATPDRPALSGAEDLGEQKLRAPDQMNIQFVSGGPFMMGSSPDDPDARPHERPQHLVELSPFWIDQTEVSHDQYRLCFEAGACEPPVLRTLFNDPAFGNHPVVYVKWEQAADYCDWLAQETGWPVALPTEAQWEKAAAWNPQTERHQRFPWGEQSPTADHANLNLSGLNQTAPVDSYPRGASPYGVLNMAGNTWEWVADWYDPDYYATPNLPPDPTGPATGGQHVMRGGSYGFGAVEARTAHRTAGGSQANGVGLGFRCVVNVDELP